MPKPKPWIDGSNAGIARALRNDSEALRYAEWWTRRKIYGLEDAELRWLRDQYLAAYNEIMNMAAGIVGTDAGIIFRNQAQIEREIDAITNTLMRQHSNRLNDALPQGWRQGNVGRTWLLDTVTAQDFIAAKNVLVPTEAIRAALASPYIGTDGWINLRRKTLIDGVKRSVVQGLIQGEGMNAIRDRLALALGIKPGQTKNFEASMYQALVITRQEVMRASNQGALAIYEQNDDVVKGWEWVATNDERTCRICAQLDGKVFLFDSNQGHVITDRVKKGGQTVWGKRSVRQPPPSGSHIGCRCTVVPVLRDADMLDPELRRPRELYPEWAARNGITFAIDGGLSAQRASDAHGLNRTSAV